MMLSNFFNQKRPKFDRIQYHVSSNTTEIPKTTATTTLTSIKTRTSSKNYEKDYDGIKIFQIFNRPSNEIILPTTTKKSTTRLSSVSLVSLLSLSSTAKPFYRIKNNVTLNDYQNFKKDICNLSQSQFGRQPYDYPFDYEYNNIWKLSFFVLAFIIGFISLFIILSFTIKYLITSIKKFRIFGHNTYQIHHGQSTQGSSKISTISLYESESEKSSNNAYNFDQDITFPPKSLDSLSKTRKQFKKHGFSKDNEYSPYQGVTNTCFVDDHNLTLMPYDTVLSQNGVLCTFSKGDIKTSFRPYSNDTKNVKQKCQSMIDLAPAISDIDLTNNRVIESDKLKQNEWRQLNDYEALETTTVGGSITNLSTTAEQLTNPKSSFRISLITNLDKRNSNNNELIARSQKITEELEIKLKERRLLVESQSDTQPNDIRIVNIEESHSCGCPCHTHSTQHTCHSTTKPVVETKIKSTFFHRQINPNLKLEQMEIIMSKRESLRKLMENKAVSGNKRKSELEKHLTSLLCSRANSTYELNDQI